MSGAVWLASYPKSGNTWTRLALLSLQSDGAAIGLSDLSSFGGMATARRLFDGLLEVDSGHLTHDEIDDLRPAFHDLHFEKDEPQLCKVHDLWFRTSAGRPVFDRRHTHAAIYLLRDPRDVAVSWARFSNLSVDWAIGYLANTRARVAANRKHIDNNIPQKLGTWSNHVTSWVDESGLEPLVVRYEDMIADMSVALTRMAHHLGWPAEPEAVAGAVMATRFERLAEQERRHGFMEMPDSAPRFFVSGRAGGWRDVLTAEQAARIEQDHGAVMRRFGYL